MTVAVDEATVRQFLEIISEHAVELAKSAGRSGVLQLCCLSPHDEKMVPSRFRLDDVDTMVKAAVGAANAALNVYIEARTVRAGLRGNVRGSLDDTEFVFGLVVDADHDKGKGGSLIARPSLTVETSPGNFHHWYLLCSADLGQAGQGDRRRDSRQHRSRPGDRRRDPMLSGRRHAEFSLEGQAGARAHRRSSRPASSNGPAGCGIR